MVSIKKKGGAARNEPRRRTTKHQKHQKQQVFSHLLAPLLGLVLGPLRLEPQLRLLLLQLLPLRLLLVQPVREAAQEKLGRPPHAHLVARGNKHAHRHQGFEAAVRVLVVHAVEELEEAVADAVGEAAHHAKVVVDEPVFWFCLL